MSFFVIAVVGVVPYDTVHHSAVGIYCEKLLVCSGLYSRQISLTILTLFWYLPVFLIDCIF